ncbi:MAG: hypothetical protein M1828_002288 [Chrysothrix sp. TS-e1954]|nr:MAG: hypothetical protein M1828_002288 [Chrysothrix sp. TS-e1954]
MDPALSDVTEPSDQLAAILNELKQIRREFRTRLFTWRDFFNILAIIAGLIIAGLFGYYAIPSYHAALEANTLAHEGLRTAALANVLTLTSICYAAPPSDAIVESSNLKDVPTYPSCLADLRSRYHGQYVPKDDTTSAGNWIALINDVMPDPSDTRHDPVDPKPHEPVEPVPERPSRTSYWPWAVALLSLSIIVLESVQNL